MKKKKGFFIIFFLTISNNSRIFECSSLKVYDLPSQVPLKKAIEESVLSTLQRVFVTNTDPLSRSLARFTMTRKIQ